MLFQISSLLPKSTGAIFLVRDWVQSC